MAASSSALATGSVIEFRSVVDAVNSAIEVAGAMVERNAEVALDKRIEFRIGIHLGDMVEETDGDHRSLPCGKAMHSPVDTTTPARFCNDYVH
jgi:class 3 adenylate cyclase